MELQFSYLRSYSLYLASKDIIYIHMVHVTINIDQTGSKIFDRHSVAIEMTSINLDNLYQIANRSTSRNGKQLIYLIRQLVDIHLYRCNHTSIRWIDCQIEVYGRITTILSLSGNVVRRTDRVRFT